MEPKIASQHDATRRKSTDSESKVSTPSEKEQQIVTPNEKDVVETSTSVDRRASETTIDQEKQEGNDALRKTSTTESQIVYPTGVKLALITLALSLAIFLVALVSQELSESVSD